MSTQPDDLTFDHDQGVLNIRVLIVISTPDGYVFEKSNDGYYFTIGGRVKIHETTIEAAQRELKEELNVETNTLKLMGLIENFFVMNDRKYHEYNFVFQLQLENSIDLNSFSSDGDNEGFITIKEDDLHNYDIRPKVIPDLIASTDTFCHFINKDM